MLSSHILSGLITLLLIIIFIGICLWAYSSKRREDFIEASNLPLQDESEQEGNSHE